MATAKKTKPTLPKRITPVPREEEYGNMEMAGVMFNCGMQELGDFSPTFTPEAEDMLRGYLMDTRATVTMATVGDKQKGWNDAFAYYGFTKVARYKGRSQVCTVWMKVHAAAVK